MKTYISSDRILTEKGIIPAIIEIEHDKISNILPSDYPIKENHKVENYGNLLIIPGVVDIHVHINEPGRTEWEGFETATKAAGCGGVTTLIDMPLNSSPVTINSSNFQQKLAAAKDKLFVDCGFWGGIVPESLPNIGEFAQSGVLGFKSFMIHSGIDEFCHMPKDELRQAYKVLADYDLPYLLHAETDVGVSIPQQKIGSSYANYLNSRPEEMEIKAIQTLIELCAEFQVKTHIVHLSTAKALPLIAAAKEKGLPLTVETCPHYLFFSSEMIPDGDPLYKCAPPVRDDKNRHELISALKTGLIDTIGSDHSPAPPAVKNLVSGDLGEAWGGISSLQWTLQIMLSLADQYQIPYSTLFQALSGKPAQVAGLAQKKGAIKENVDADFVVLDDKQSYIPTSEEILFKHRISPYVEQKLRGKICSVFLRGNKIVDGNELCEEKLGEVIIHE